MEAPELDPLNRIALCFSGGGYRAAAFNLGTLSYFNNIQFKQRPLLKRVEGLSTVSGGTLVGAAYAAQTSKGKSFQQFYQDFWKWLEEDNLLEIALKKLQSDRLWKNTSKRRSLINAFALSYHEMVTDTTMADLYQHEHLKDICFNSTDFSFGLAFRFQTPNGDFGNYRLKSEELDKLGAAFNISDAMAASSCFPLGFEPMIMPDDFFRDHNNPDYQKLKSQNYMHGGVGLMDGGIVDNQGIGSIMNADKRRKKDNQQFDLIMVCDVASYKMNPWDKSDEVSDKGSGSIFSLWRKWSTRKKLLIFASLFTALTLALLWFGLKADIDSNRVTLLVVLAWVSSIPSAILWGLWLLSKLSLKLLAITFDFLHDSLLPSFLRGKLGYFSRLRFSLLSRILKERLSSGVKMVNEVFLKQIRRLNYNLFYAKGELENRRITSLIYELTRDEFLRSESDERTKNMKVAEKIILPKPSEEVFNVAQIATDTGTALWFDEKDRKLNRLKNLVACGQFTTCYNLLDYVLKLPDEHQTPEIKALTEVLQKDWETFNNDPFWLV
ncbi:patatin-like phospholipase family protein [Roseivirga pacifica]|uniref:patatin-like phospholipase family protein n=1 Tax=Roseivirga pacifica TaxID=1267423 RepID=UPI0020949214|nr:patatin-like phospholipase family protein [Roseivirga pacifica]MCO6359147.1 hypothetical protein [Roseivirga pacifica]MCO6365217.1 hypothetical protein [Roseivirga pacifica]MCO6372053.1 hypothetical protein [Roseivirga pacifica]MCO6375836.1 hypothetical protein [Roseivirga pacifica]MCO6379431.1 hypothetical protein [Roseivirga pacifica]